MKLTGKTPEAIGDELGAALAAKLEVKRLARQRRAAHRKALATGVSHFALAHSTPLAWAHALGMPRRVRETMGTLLGVEA